MITNKSGLTAATLKGVEEDRGSKREALQAAAEKYMGAIQAQVGDLKVVGKNTLIIGGVILAGYFITDMLLPDIDENEKITSPERNYTHTIEEESFLFSMLKGVATTALLALAREQLMKLIDRLPENEPTTAAK